MNDSIPLVYACAGCSPAGRLAYDLAQELDRRGIAEMSCLAGVGAARPHFLKQLDGREVWIIDGCPIECSLGVFGQVPRQVNIHIRLHDLGVRKKTGAPPQMDMDRLVKAALEHVREQQAHRQPRAARREDGDDPSTPALTIALPRPAIQAIAEPAA
jgi:uncharacterized metal-binding protein